MYLGLPVASFIVCGRCVFGDKGRCGTVPADLEVLIVNGQGVILARQVEVEVEVVKGRDQLLMM